MATDDPIDEELLVSLLPSHLHPSGEPNTTRLAVAMGRSRSGIQKAVRRLARAGTLGFKAVLPGFAVKQTSEQRDDAGNVQKTWIKQAPIGETFEVPEGHSVKGVSALVDAQGATVQRWIKTKSGEIDPQAIVDGLQEHFSKFKPAAPVSVAPAVVFVDQLALYPWSDPHFGVQIWGRETSGSDWDLKIAVKTIRDAFEKVVSRTPATKKSILLVGGDTLHSESNENRTAKSGNALQVDGRLPKVMLTACETIVGNTDILLAHHEEVEVIILGGNHDESSAYAIAFFLHAWYRNDPRVNVDISPSLFRFREFGKVMIGTTHGHMAKIKDMPSIMAARQPEMWGRTVWRFCLGFHVHHASKTLSEGGGCITETFQIIAPADAWHFNQGYVAGRSLQSIVYDREHGEVGRTRVSVV